MRDNIINSIEVWDVMLLSLMNHISHFLSILRMTKNNLSRFNSSQIYNFNSNYKIYLYFLINRNTSKYENHKINIIILNYSNKSFKLFCHILSNFFHRMKYRYTSFFSHHIHIPHLLRIIWIA